MAKLVIHDVTPELLEMFKGAMDVREEIACMDARTSASDEQVVLCRADAIDSRLGMYVVDHCYFGSKWSLEP